MFVEEPTHPENVDALLDIAQSTSIPIATGERNTTRWGFREICEKRAAAVLQPDIRHCGGILEMRKIASLAEIHYLSLAPHSASDPLGVVASVHASFNLTEKEMTARLIKAMENPHVTMLGHLSGRLLLRRDPYAVNHEKIIDCAAETGTVIELNCSSKRMDMDWRWWRRARDKGVKCSLNPDAHHATGLQNLHFGIRVARKGWLRRQDVLNCLPAKDIQKWLQTPKAKRL